MEKTASFVGLVAVNVCLSLLIALSKSSGHSYSYNPASAITIAEVVKLLLSLSSYVNENDAYDFLSYVSINFALSYISLALIYCLNNQLTFTILSMTNPGNLTLFKSSTPFITAMLQRILFGTPLTKLRWACVVVLCSGLVTTQWNDCTMGFHIEKKAYFALVLSVVLTSLASVLNAKAIKSFSPIPLSLHNATLYLFGACFNAITYQLASARIIYINSDAGFFEGYDNIYAVLIIFFSSIIGILITLLYKYGDAVIKCFAQVISSIILVLLSVWIFDYQLTVTSFCGCLSVFAASYIYLILSPETDERELTADKQGVDSKGETERLIDETGEASSGDIIEVGEESMDERGAEKLQLW